tara:strand:- start:97 stop:321 length:225 start_codon:yes stop_codon:yes gene_type:complete
MSAEKLTSTDQQDLTSTSIMTPEVKEESIRASRVDINDLLAKVRKEKEKENKINLVFFGLFSCLILVVGTILSF